jgi:hypothetical protein
MIYRNKKLLEITRQLPCQLCGKQDGTVVAAHSNQQRDGKGTGIKAADYRVAALCYGCHMELDQGKLYIKSRRIELWEEAHRNTIGALFEQGYLKPNLG